MPYNPNDNDRYKITFIAMVGILFCIIFMWITKLL